MSDIAHELSEINYNLTLLNGNLAEITKAINNLLMPIYDGEQVNNNILLIRKALQDIDGDLNALCTKED